MIYEALYETKQDWKENKLTDRLTYSSNNWCSNKQILIC